MTAFTALDTSFMAIATVNTCSHLRLREMPARPHRFYGSCRIGDVAARERWVALVSRRHLDGIRAIQEALAQSTAPQVAELYVAKSALLRAPGSDPEMARARAAVTAYMEVADAVLRGHAGALEEIGLPLATCLDLLRAVLDLWLESSTMEPPPIPEELLIGLPPAARALVAPEGR